jgi:hypothetical protein
VYCMRLWLCYHNLFQSFAWFANPSIAQLNPSFCLYNATTIRTR